MCVCVCVNVHSEHDGIKQNLANYGPFAKSGSPFAFVKVLSEYIHTQMAIEGITLRVFGQRKKRSFIG